LLFAELAGEALNGKKPRDLKREVILREKAGIGPYEEQWSTTGYRSRSKS